MRCSNVVCATIGAVALLLASPAAADSSASTPTPVGANGAAEGGAARPTPIVITNETLQKYSGQGHVTEVGRTGGGPPSSPVRPVHGGAGGDTVVVPDTAVGEQEIANAADRRYWRSLYERQLALVAQIERQIEILDREIPGLWRDFYAHDDPMYRDGVIKPKLDDALVRRQQLETQLEQERAQLPKIREDARRAGAQPGWFRGLDTPKPRDEASFDEGSVLPSDSGLNPVTADDVAPDQGTQ